MKTIFTIFLIAMAGVCISQTQYIAHRGASYLAPENTAASAKLAWELGADAVEIDIHITKDNRIMVIHDNTSKRTCKGKNMEIETAPSIMLRELDAGIFKGEEFKGEKIPFLSEIINLIPQGKKLVVEIKCKKEVLPHLKKVIEKTGKSDQIIFICFDWKTIVETKSEFPENSCYWLSGMNTGLKKRMEQAAKIGLEGVNLKHSIIDEKVMALANDLNLEVLTWTVDDPQEAKRLIDLGVSQITTNRPKWLKSQVTENN